MADMTDVADVLVGLIASAVYPNGTSQAPAGGVQAKIYQGWPDPAALTKDLAAQIANVSVWPSPQEKVTTRRMAEWQQLVAPAPTLTLAVAGTTITIGGNVSTPQAVDLIVDGKDFAYAVQQGETTTTIATALATLVSAVQPASSAGPVVSVPGAHKVLARIAASGTSAREVALEQRTFKVSIWADCFDRREPLAKVITPMLADLSHIALPDFTAATAWYSGSQQVDTQQKQGIYRRDIDLSVEYSTIVTRIDTAVGIVQVHPSIVSGSGSVALPIINE